MIPSGNTLVLGGLVQDDVRNNNTKIPLLGDIPYLGYAFRSENKTRAKSNLLIFITPTIVQDSDYQPTSSDFLKTPVVESVEGEWTAWDTASCLRHAPTKRTRETNPPNPGPRGSGFLLS